MQVLEAGDNYRRGSGEGFLLLQRRLPFDLSPRPTLIWDSLSANDSAAVRHLVRRQKRSRRPLVG